ncbi:phosphomevalonate kinase-like [Stylophora pistillata]|uniref:phosphomevalonate kinase-like n=1 Tax=Stylophora pistillata TaxID=50429 RepID=UPI000C03B017|nr:phosphomevalonate kinase-like [Stylophora pistillata]
MADVSDQQHVPKVIFILSGKRKSGKDFVANKLKETFRHDICEIIRLSGPLKYEYAQQHGLDFGRLLDSTTYKEFYRQDMIRWGEEKRRIDPSYFCKLVTKMVSSATPEESRTVQKPVWIISDARRKSDVNYFKTNYDKVLHVRIVALEDVRKSRGWVFTAGVDDAESECGLDDEKFDFVIHNNGDDNEKLNSEFNSLLRYAC